MDAAELVQRVAADEVVPEADVAGPALAEVSVAQAVAAEVEVLAQVLAPMAPMAPMAAGGVNALLSTIILPTNILP